MLNPAVFQGIGPGELLIVLAIVLVIFGPKRLPQLGRQLGAGLREFKDSVTAKREEDDEDAPPPELTAPPARPAEPVEGEVVRERRP